MSRWLARRAHIQYCNLATHTQKRAKRENYRVGDRQFSVLSRYSESVVRADGTRYKRTHVVVVVVVQMYIRVKLGRNSPVSLWSPLSNLPPRKRPNRSLMINTAMGRVSSDVPF